MDSKTLNAVSSTVNAVLQNGAKTGTKYLTPRLTVRVSQMTFNGKLQKGNVELRVTIGKPNAKARDFIKSCLKAREAFPVKKIQLRFPKK